MTERLQQAKQRLQEGRYTCVVCGKDRVCTSNLRGVKPLVAWYAEGQDFHGFTAADRVVGKATAFLYVLLGVEAVYADVISKAALAVFEIYRITAAYGVLVDHIINRQGDGICPFEAAVLHIDDAAQGYQAIRKKMLDMNIHLD